MYKKHKKAVIANPNDPRRKHYDNLIKMQHSRSHWVGRVGKARYDVMPYLVRGISCWRARGNGQEYFARTLAKMSQLLRDVENGNEENLTRYMRR